MSDLVMYVIYERPSDYPDRYVVREWAIEGDGAKPTERFQLAETLESARDLLPKYAARLEPSESDDPCIVEVWI